MNGGMGGSVYKLILSWIVDDGMIGCDLEDCECVRE